MAIFKCKMCGGDLSFQPGNSTGICDYCGAEQTLPKVVDENLQGLFNRANTLRMKAEFDKAAEIYEKILQASGTEAEAYWGLILCKYGIEYVEDPVTYKRVPTCHRASYDAVTVDDDYKMALQYADVSQRMIYETEAKQIDEIQKGIIALAQKEDPYDVFICYKETDENGQRTQDSVLANDIYYQLTQEGFKVFYAAITLEDKLGQEYEPYIFSALNSAKVMLVLGTKPEYFSAVWVKNEWSRFLKLMKKDRAKMMIPCYRDMDAYELPQEFAHLQAQNMEKIGFINDIVRGIKKITGRDELQTDSAQEKMVVQQMTVGTNVAALLKRGNMALEDGEWKQADDFFEEVLNQDPECAEAYLGKLMVQKKCNNFDKLQKSYIEKYGAIGKKNTLRAGLDAEAYINKIAAEYEVPGYLNKNEIINLYKYDWCFQSAVNERKEQKQIQLKELEENKYLTRARQYASDSLKSKINLFLNTICNELDNRIKTEEETDKEIATKLKQEYDEFLKKQTATAERMSVMKQEKREKDYQSLVSDMKNITSISAARSMIDRFAGLGNYKQAPAMMERCKRRLEEIEKTVQKSKKNKRKKVKIICAISGIFVVVVVLVVIFAGIPFYKAKKIQNYQHQHEFAKAEEYIKKEFKGEKQKDLLKDNDYCKGIGLIISGDYEKAIEILKKIENYKDSKTKIKEADYLYACNLMEQKEYIKAENLFEKLDDYKDSKEKLIKLNYMIGIQKEEKGEYSSAIDYLSMCSSDYEDCQSRLVKLNYLYAEELAQEDITKALPYYEKAKGYLESDSKVRKIKKYLKKYKGEKKIKYKCIKYKGMMRTLDKAELGNPKIVKGKFMDTLYVYNSWGYCYELGEVVTNKNGKKSFQYHKCEDNSDLEYEKINFKGNKIILACYDYDDTYVFAPKK